MYPKLKALMIENKISGSVMANLLNISESTFSQKLNGHRDFKKSEIDKILSLFGVSYETIFFSLDVRKTRTDYEVTV